jgi:hypothetical protein
VKRGYTVATGPTGDPVDLWADSYPAAVALWAEMERGPAMRGEAVDIGNLRPVLDAFASLAGPALAGAELLERDGWEPGK